MDKLTRETTSGKVRQLVCGCAVDGLFLCWDHVDPINKSHHRCMHCGAYFDECRCDGGRS